jgi:hypothetical protein
MAKTKAKIGDKIVIKGFAGNEPSAADYIGKTGVVESINELGDISGTWGSLSLVPTDDYDVLAECESVHIYEIEGSDSMVFVLPRQLDDLLQQVYETGLSNADCRVDGISYIGC